MATDEVTPTESVNSGRVVTMDVFKGLPPSLVNLGKSAPFGWWPAVILSLVSLLDRLEQSVLAGAVPSIKEYFGVGNFAVGLIASATGIAGVILFIPAGRIADRTNRTRALAFVLVSWSVLSIGSGLAVSFAMLLSMRALIGAAGQLNNPAGSSLLADYYPGKTRTKVFGIERLVYFLGNPIGVILGAVIAEAFGWQWVFIGLVIPGFLVAIGCWFLREPRRGTSDRIDRLREGLPEYPDHGPVDVMPEGTVPDVSVWTDVRLLLKVATLRSIYISQAALYFGLGGLFFFTPTFFNEALGIAEDKSGAYAGMVGLVGVFVGATVGIRLGSRFQGIRPGWRVTTGAIGLAIGTAGVGILGVAHSVPVAIAGFLVVNVGFMIAIPNLAASVADLSGSVRRGMAFSVNQFVVGISSAMGPAMIGLFADWFGFNAAYALMIPPLALAAFITYRARTTYEDDVAAAGGISGSNRAIAGGLLVAEKGKDYDPDADPERQD